MIYLLDIVRMISDSPDFDMLELEAILISAICRLVQQVFEMPFSPDDDLLGKAFEHT